MLHAYTLKTFLTNYGVDVPIAIMLLHNMYINLYSNPLCKKERSGVKIEESNLSFRYHIRVRLEIITDVLYQVQWFVTSINKPSPAPRIFPGQRITSYCIDNRALFCI